MPITRALIERHAKHRDASYEVALLDVAQDHLLYYYQIAGFFDRTNITFKGGTSLRKCRLGNDGRFSTDIDLSVVSDNDVEDIILETDGAKVGGFEFSVEESGKNPRIWALQVKHEVLGNVLGVARLEFAKRPLVLPPEKLNPVFLPIHKEYGFKLAALPVIKESEACAEKLARYRRQPLARDLYDLFWFSKKSLDEKLIRRLWILKTYCDVIEDNRGSPPIEASQILSKRGAKDFPAAEIGKLVQPYDLEDWENKIHLRFSFLKELDEDEKRWALCNRRDHSEVLEKLRNSGF